MTSWRWASGCEGRARWGVGDEAAGRRRGASGGRADSAGEVAAWRLREERR